MRVFRTMPMRSNKLEAAFYAQVNTGSYYAAAAAEKQILNDLAGHEAIHRDFLKAAISANCFTLLPNLMPYLEQIFWRRPSASTR